MTSGAGGGGGAGSWAHAAPAPKPATDRASTCAITRFNDWSFTFPLLAQQPDVDETPGDPDRCEVLQLCAYLVNYYISVVFLPTHPSSRALRFVAEISPKSTIFTVLFAARTCGGIAALQQQEVLGTWRYRCAVATLAAPRRPTTRKPIDFSIAACASGRTPPNPRSCLRSTASRRVRGVSSAPPPVHPAFFPCRA